MFQLYLPLIGPHGGKGAEELAKTVVETIESSDNNFNFLYPDEMPLWDKMETIAKKIYGASSITASASVKKQIEELQNNGYGEFPSMCGQDAVFLLH